MGLLSLLLLGACGDPNPREVEGALAKALSAASSHQAEELFRVIDQRSRHAMSSIVKDRHATAAAIRDGYPKSEQAAALEALGDAAVAKDPPDLFRLRCDVACMDGFAAKLGGPASQVVDGDVLHVTTTRGATVDLYHGSDTWYGLVWQTQALFRERVRAAAEREMVMRNVAVYAKREALE